MLAEEKSGPLPPASGAPDSSSASSAAAPAASVASVSSGSVPAASSSSAPAVTISVSQPPIESKIDMTVPTLAPESQFAVIDSPSASLMSSPEAAAAAASGGSVPPSPPGPVAAAEAASPASTSPLPPAAGAGAEEEEDHDRRMMAAQLKQLQDEFEQLTVQNAALVQRVIRVRQKKSQEENKGSILEEPNTRNETADQKYDRLLDKFVRSKQEFLIAQQSDDAYLSKLDDEYKRRDQQSKKVQIQLQLFKRDVAKNSIDSCTGKPLPMKTLFDFEQKIGDKDMSVEVSRLRNIQLKNAIAKVEEQVRQRERLGEGLHLIDFEQLKIENQTLNEKIEERNDELHRLRKKTTTTVQILTHIKEKLHFVEEEKRSWDSELSKLESEVSVLRDELTKNKQMRDSLRGENTQLKHKQGFVGSDLLVIDFVSRKMQLTKLQEQLADLQQKHTQLTRIVQQGNLAEAQLRAHQQSHFLPASSATFAFPPSQTFVGTSSAAAAPSSSMMMSQQAGGALPALPPAAYSASSSSTPVPPRSAPSVSTNYTAARPSPVKKALYRA